LFNKGVSLGQLERSEDAIAVYDQVLAWFADAPEPALRELVANALYNKGVRLGRLDRLEDAIVVYDQVLAWFADVPELALRRTVADALLNRGIMLRQLSRFDDAIAAFDEMLVRFADAPEPEFREQVANALVNKGITLGQLYYRSEDAIAAYDQVLARFADAPEPELREHVANALYNKGIKLGRMDRFGDALAVYDQIVARFAEAPEPTLRQTVADARRERGSTLLQLDRLLNEDGEVLCPFCGRNVWRTGEDGPCEHLLADWAGDPGDNGGGVLGEMLSSDEGIEGADELARLGLRLYDQVRRAGDENVEARLRLAAHAVAGEKPAWWVALRQDILRDHDRADIDCADPDDPMDVDPMRLAWFANSMAWALVQDLPGISVDYEIIGGMTSGTAIFVWSEDPVEGRATIDAAFASVIRTVEAMSAILDATDA